MTDTELLIWLRYTLAVLACGVVIWLVALFGVHWKRLDPGRKLWTTGSVCVLLYTADACREAASIGLEFKWRLIPLIVGLIAYFAYLLEPTNRKLTRFKRDILD